MQAFKSNPTKDQQASLIKLWMALNSAAGRRLTQVEAGYYALGSILIKCQNLQNLVLAGGIYSFPLVAISQGRSLPLPFLSHSLKRLFLNSSAHYKSNMTAQIMIWILGELKRSLVSPLALKLTSNLSPGLLFSPHDLNGNSVLPMFDTGFNSLHFRLRVIRLSFGVLGNLQRSIKSQTASSHTPIHRG